MEEKIEISNVPIIVGETLASTSIAAATALNCDTKDEEAIGVAGAEESESSIRLQLKSNKGPLGRLPKLERKHSSGDLHSRLKTRKMLGVGETDNGDIHRSKISQVLGHNEHLYIKMPKGYWNWQAFLAALLAFQACFIIALPESAANLGLLGVVDSQPPPITPHPITSQYYAVTMLALSYILWKFLNLKDKGVTRTTLFAIIFHLAALCIVDVINAIIAGLWSALWDVKLLTMNGLRVTTIVICMVYLSKMGSATSGLRKSPSHKDVSDHNNTANPNRRE